jgi:hypothetical protein
MMLYLSDMTPLRYYLEVKRKTGETDKSFDNLLLPVTLDVGERQAQLLPP